MLSSNTLLLVLCFLSLLSFSWTASLKQYNIDKSKITVSGLSAGAFFAVQYHVAWSSQIKGAGVFAGGPYYCAQGNLLIAEDYCMALGLINVDALVKDAQSFAASGDIDSLNNLASSRVFLYSGTKDLVVTPKVVKAAESWYANFMSTSSIGSEYTIQSEHCQPTQDYGNRCSYLGEPYINDCDYDGAGTNLQWLYKNTLKTPTLSANSSNIFSFSQGLYLSGATTTDSISLGDTGYIYVPTFCQNTTHQCLLHIVFHGCEQTLSDVGDIFYTHAGYNNWAETNGIIVMYPQAKRSKSNPSNPNGCFDWWGYTNQNYALKKGPQIGTVHNMMLAVTGSF